MPAICHKEWRRSKFKIVIYVNFKSLMQMSSSVMHLLKVNSWDKRWAIEKCSKIKINVLHICFIFFLDATAVEETFFLGEWMKDIRQESRITEWVMWSIGRNF